MRLGLAQVLPKAMVMFGAHVVTLEGPDGTDDELQFADYLALKLLQDRNPDP